MKICSTCKVLKRKNEFYKNSSSKNGFKSQCKECVSEIDKLRNNKYYKCNIERKKIMHREYSESYRDKYPSKQSEYQKSNKLKFREYAQKRRALKDNNLGFIFSGMIELLSCVQDKMCFYCSVSIEENSHLDHKLPLSRGGKHTWSNLCLACPSCNLRKHTKTAEEFMSEI